MANISIREGKFRVRVRRNGVSISKTFASQAEASAWGEIKTGEISGDTYEDRTREKRTSLKAVLQRYRVEVTPTKKGYKQEANRLKEWESVEWAILPLTAISPAHITEWRNGRIAAGKAPSTINNMLNLLSGVFKIARSEWGYKINNPLLGIRRVTPRPPRHATPDSRLEKYLLAKAAERLPFMVPIVTIAAWTAMRAGEIRKLKWRDVDLDKHAITLYDRRTKNDHGRVVVALDVVTESLRAWAGDKDLSQHQDDWIFPGRRSLKGPISEHTITHDFVKIMQDVLADPRISPKPRRITFHDLRHWGTTRLAPLHRDALDLALTTGHKTLRSLARYYNPDDLDRIAQIRERSHIEKDRINRKSLNSL